MAPGLLLSQCAHAGDLICVPDDCDNARSIMMSGVLIGSAIGISFIIIKWALKAWRDGMPEDPGPF
jgi:hypothetical protein